jgi:hypothetical protein|tara:strand:- start:6208 stop:6609 length:402 start_codon:yes stop_codon:yes gene_type:complete
MDTTADEIEVANGRKITLPALTVEDKERARLPEMRIYIRQGLHHPDWIGWPNPNNDFKHTGILIQTLDDQTARVLLVIDDEDPLKYLAALKFAYDFMGYVLHIDYATVLRSLSKEPSNSIESTREVVPSIEFA